MNMHFVSVLRGPFIADSIRSLRWRRAYCCAASSEWTEWLPVLDEASGDSYYYHPTERITSWDPQPPELSKHYTFMEPPPALPTPEPELPSEPAKETPAEGSTKGTTEGVASPERNEDQAEVVASWNGSEVRSGAGWEPGHVMCGHGL